MSTFFQPQFLCSKEDLGSRERWGETDPGKMEQQRTATRVEGAKRRRIREKGRPRKPRFPQGNMPVHVP
jgi:hypothetical protein